MTGRRLTLGVLSAALVGLVIGLVSINNAGFQISSLFGGSSDVASTKPAEQLKGILKAKKAATDARGAWEYEFEMTKDPATGTIPEGIYEAESAQADEIVQMQRSRRIPEFASYNFVGPDNLGGRTRTVAYDVRYNGTSNRTILAGGVSGGVYKSTDDGASWVRKSPTGQHYSCTSLAQDTRAGFQDTWYYTVGESLGNSANATGAGYSGNGVYKSTDNGETWTRLPNSNTSALESFSTNADYTLKIIVDPTNGNVYLGATAAIIRSTDGGATWVTVLNGTLQNSGQTTDIIVTSGGILYAAFAGSNTAGIDGVWRSTTGAAGSWTRIAGAGSPTNPPGWNPQGISTNTAAYGRVVLALAPSLQTRVYALYNKNVASNCANAPAPEAEFYYWNDTNSTWTDISATLPDEQGCLSGNDPFAVQGGYDLVIGVKPDDANTVFIGGTNAYRSTDTGATWTRIGGYNSPANYALYPNSHPDIHSFVFQPGSPTTMLCGNDGGIQRTTDNLAGTVVWAQINTGYRTYQYYYAVNDPRNASNKVLGGAQDNGTTRNVGGSGSTFESVFGGDGVSVGLSDPAATGGIQYEYLGAQLGLMARIDAADGNGFFINPENLSGGLFVTLFKLDPDNTERLYYVIANRLYRTASASTVTQAVTGANSWTRMTGIEAANTTNNITAVGLTRGAYNAATSSLFFATSNGRVFRLDDPSNAAAAAAPVEISLGAGLPVANVSSIAVSPTNDDTVMVTFSNYGVASVFLTNNANAAAPTWTNVENNLTLPSFRSSAIINVGGTLEYFVGTSAGLYRITNPTTAGSMWTQEGSTTIGNAVISSLDLRPSDNKLLVGTHGIGLWTNIEPTAAAVAISGRVMTPTRRGISQATVTLVEPSGNIRTVRTNAFGYYRFDDLEAGQTARISVTSKRYRFSTQVVNLLDSVTDVDFIAQDEFVAKSE